MTSFDIQDLIKARISLEQFRKYSVSPHHERYGFPFLAGTYFAYRRIDVLRLVSISKAISDDPKYLDVGCGYGDFLNKVREFLGNAIGIEKDVRIFYNFNIPKPDYIRIADARWQIEEEYDLIFVGWMDPGVDFTDAVAAKTNAVVTTLDQGISQAAEFDAHGFRRIAYWRTPSWEDVNTEIMNRYYTKMSAETRRVLFELRGAHNLWYVYSKKPSISRAIKSALLERLEEEKKVPQDRYDFEDVLDECGFMYLQGLHNINNNLSDEKQQDVLWDVKFVES
jgi:SAM-dependent methyltransferase